ncbi:isopenicillin N synthase family dioxygenase [Sandarakinorhabdus sp. DWP1-3-1]|uniref:isopenicillin N synthase family dioxygenase n=1 Tax=Sandarakinorhabdus sp. DWP1-3-1 TaxID=2804627 RepID=UPI003CF7B8D1
MADTLPIIDMAALFGTDTAARRHVATAIDSACRDRGFFYLTGHGIAPSAFAAIEAAAHDFFDRPAADKARIAMRHGGRAWRGWFPLHGELTSGQPDGKEGLYLGEDLGPDDPRVAAGWPLHGANLWPATVPALRPAVESWMAGAARAAHALAAGMALALDLPADHFARRYTASPTLLFRIFRYPPGETGFGVGEHTDYGFLTLLAQDRHGGLEVRTPGGWLAAPPIPGALVVNIGDMLDRLTGGVWRSTPHRVVNGSGQQRLSWPLFFDPAFDAVVEPLPGFAPRTDHGRWDGASVHAPMGRYGDYLLGKVGKVFPELSATAL